MENQNRSRVKQLSPEVARKIAAGEVIDRPCAIVRELLDNAVDSGAQNITVEIKNGGIEKIRISDDGCGFSKEDLANCARPHATSKISDAQDLLRLTTLGFRGEALASMAAVSRLTIFSGSWKMNSSITEDHVLEEIPAIQNGKGSIIQTEGLFENFPARRMFLKRPASETLLCKEVFVEKALPRTDIAFRLELDGNLRFDLPKGVPLAKRFVSAMELKKPSELFYEIKGKSKDKDENGEHIWSFTLVLGEPSVYRNDRKQLFIYVNGRKISEYSLLQAIEYGCQGFFPNGVHPVGALFVKMNPAMVDFNIHPAKKEARFKDIGDLHHGVSSTVKEFLRSWTIKTVSDQRKSGSENAEAELDFGNFESDFSDSGASSESKILSVEENPPQNAFNAETAPQNARQPQNASFFQNASQNATQNASHAASSQSARSRFFSEPRSMSSYRSSGYSNTENRSLEKILDFGFETKNPSAAENASNAEIAPQNASNAEIASQNASNAENAPHNASNAEIAPQNAQKHLSFLPQKSENAEIKRSSISIRGVYDDFRFLGTAMKLFFVCEYKGSIYLIDQHAAHERILFDQIINSQKKQTELLIPIEISTESDEEDKYLENAKGELQNAGFTLEKSGEKDSLWLITKVPEDFEGKEKDLIKDILIKRTEAKEICYKISATRACKKAIKDGYIVDDETAEEIARKALNLKDPHCPHGRPIWTILTKEELFERVRRT